MGRGSEVAHEFKKFLDHRSVVQNCPLGALAHLGLAPAYVLQGDKTKARTAYQDFSLTGRTPTRTLPSSSPRKPSTQSFIRFEAA